MPNGRCRMHGGASTGARTPEGRERARRAPLTHGRRSAAHAAMKQQMRVAFVQLRDMVRAAEAEWREEQRLHREMLRRFGR
ncbi:HGGxSTG domain-containing protein (plasmid) [Methylobacterium phyllosphaerae]